MIFYQPTNSRSNFNYNAYTYTDTSYAPHFHTNLELLIVQKGSAQLTVDGACQIVHNGQMALVLSGQIHSFSVDPDSVLWVGVFAEGFVPFFTAALQGKKGNSSVFTPPASLLSFVTTQLIESETSLMMKKACLYAVCDAFLSSVVLESRPTKSSAAVSQILEWISTNYMFDISLKQAAKEFGYEYHYLSRLLNKQYHIRFLDLLNSYRVEHARELLHSTQLPITEVMLQSGFQSIRSFNMVFRTITGHTPSAYRKHPQD